MGYFTYTEADVQQASISGKREMARILAAIVADTDAKMDDPDTYDRILVIEDHLARVVSVIAPFAKEPFADWQDHTLAYPEMLAKDQTGLVRPFIARRETDEFTTRLAEDAETAIREVLANRQGKHAKEE